MFCGFWRPLFYAENGTLTLITWMIYDLPWGNVSFFFSTFQTLCQMCKLDSNMQPSSSAARFPCLTEQEKALMDCFLLWFCKMPPPPNHHLCLCSALQRIATILVFKEKSAGSNLCNTNFYFTSLSLQVFLTFKFFAILFVKWFR